ncbi:replication-relaxation family protein [Chloroflexota bacterium]
MSVSYPGQTRLPTYNRAEHPPPIHFMARDRAILEAVQSYDGILGDYQIQRLFFTGERQARGRLSLLYHNGYLSRPNRKQRAGLDCMVYWLTRRGAAIVAGLGGEKLDTFKWRRQPRWSQIRHDLAVNDIRIAVTEACDRQPYLELQEWIPEGVFWSQPDTVRYTSPKKGKAKRRVIPDGFCVIKSRGYHSRLLLEVDMRTEDNPRFGEEKVLPGIAYVRSEGYAQRFGYKSGRWLVVTTGERRMLNLKQQAERVGETSARLFYFTTFAKVNASTVLTAPIWLRGGAAELQPLFSA